MYKLSDKIIENCGNKAKYLSILKAKGYNVPFGIVIDFEEFKEIIKEQKLNFETIDKIEIPEELIDRIFSLIPKGSKYAIRSSASIEDSRNFSLAGMYNTYLNVVYDRECFKDKIKNCFLSLYSGDNLQFYRKNNININKIEMNVIIQEMIESNVSGILFTVNPTSGKDTEIVLEFSKGSGNVINGNIVPERLVYDWYNERYIEEPKINILGENSIRKIINISLSLQQELGFPIDVEFGVYDSKLYIFQVRPITRIDYKDIYYRFTSNNIDNVKILSKFMYSLEKKVYDTTTMSFVGVLNKFSPNEVVKPLIDFKFSRIYWNLTFLKRMLENVPGYVERNLDEFLGVMVDYLDNGIENLNNTKKMLKIIPKKSIMHGLKKHIINVEEFRSKKIEEIKKFNNELENIEEKDIRDKILPVINLYYDIESAYIWQLYINSMYKTNLNKRLNGIVTSTELQCIFQAVEDKYKNAPYLYMWDSTRRTIKDPAKRKFFEENLDAELYYTYLKDRENKDIKEFLTDFIDLYGYHSFNETDIIYKTYEEEILKVIKMYRDMLELDDRYDPLREFKQNNKAFEQIMEKVKMTVKNSEFKNISNNIEFVQELIKKAYCLRDLSLIARYTLRLYMIKLGKYYKNKYAIDNEEDIFNLEYKDILNTENLDEIKRIVNKNKIYFNSFRNYEPAIDIFPCSKKELNIDYSRSYSGIGASFGKIEAKACIVNSKEDLKNLKKLDILITKYIDPDIFKNVNITELSGIVTEYGGVLCHLAVNARENRIPCVVGLKDATKNIRNGENVIINGDTGEVIVN